MYVKERSLNCSGMSECTHSTPLIHGSRIKKKNDTFGPLLRFESILLLWENSLPVKLYNIIYIIQEHSSHKELPTMSNTIEVINKVLVYYEGSCVHSYSLTV